MESNRTSSSSMDQVDSEHTYANYIKSDADIYENVELSNDHDANPPAYEELRATTSDVKQQLVEEAEEQDDDDNPQCGWFGLRPNFLQVHQLNKNCSHSRVFYENGRDMYTPSYFGKLKLEGFEGNFGLLSWTNFEGNLLSVKQRYRVLNRAIKFSLAYIVRFFLSF